MEEVKADETYKKKNPYDRANFISKLFFLFLLPYFVKGYKRELTEDDMYSHRHKHDSGKLGERLEAAWQYQVKHKKNPSFIKALCSVFLSEIFMLWIIAFAAEIIRLSQPLLISKLLTLYDENQVAENQKYLYIYSGLIVLSLFITVFLTHAFFHHIMQVGMKLRIACCSLVYRKALRLNKSALAETTIGQMVNLLSNDVGRFDQATHFMHHLIMGPVEILVVMILCYFNVGYTGLIGAVFLLVSVPFQSWLGKKTSKYRLNTALRTDERVRLMNEIISGIQVIKMYAWEKSFAKLVELARMYNFVNPNNFTESFGGNMGLALTQAMGLTGMFQWGMRQWSEMENQMTSVERVQEYADLKPEKQEDTVKEPPKFWPETGRIEFRDMSLRYSPDDPCVLKNLNFIIKAKEKVGIVGRTGAGKSSLIQALFRLAIIEGSILIDDIDTRTVELKKLRSKISIIPQEPVLFSGTLRNNLDPFNEFKDELLWNALDDVEMKTAVGDLSSGLDSKMAEGGTNFSVGQRQLVCLARAILRDNKILVLDEATANVDPHTDGLIQETIRRKFANCTVLTIAHRLHTIMDSDRVLVMDAGRKAEFDHPHLLLQNEAGVFYSLVMQTGKATAKNLMAIAEGTYEAAHSQCSQE
nr:probable multidrug resistance-associated protein lethal(2)03659 [Leptinotarsa decemlineata]